MSEQPFSIHKDKLALMNELTMEERGVIFTALVEYHTGGIVPEFNDRLLNTVFMGMSQSIDYLTDSYNKRKEANVTNGKKGGRPKKDENPEKPKITDGFFQEPSLTQDNPTEPNKRLTVTDTVTDTVTVTVTDTVTDTVTESSSNINAVNNTLTPSVKKPTSPGYSDEDFKIAKFIADKIKEIAPHIKTNIPKSAEQVRLMRTQDKIPIEQIRKVFLWANSDDFWRVNILSVSKLREQYGQLDAKMRASSKWQTKASSKQAEIDRETRELLTMLED